MKRTAGCRGVDDKVSLVKVSGDFHRGLDLEDDYPTGSPVWYIYIHLP